MTDPERFQVELQFSAGAAYDPFGLAPSQPHVLPIKPRFPLFQGALSKSLLSCADVTCMKEPIKAIAGSAKHTYLPLHLRHATVA